MLHCLEHGSIRAGGLAYRLDVGLGIEYPPEARADYCVIVDDEGRPAAPGEIGNLRVRGDSTMAYYWNQHDKTKDTLFGPWTEAGYRQEYVRLARALKAGGPMPSTVAPEDMRARRIAHAALDGPDESLAQVLEHLVASKEIWLAAIEGADFPSGGDVVRVTLPRRSRSRVRRFATGFGLQDPLGLAMGPGGGLFVSRWSRGSIVRLVAR